MALKSQENTFGAWVFLIGMIIAIVVGVFASLIPSLFGVPSLIKSSQIIYATLVVLGIIVGFSINISARDEQTFLIAGVVIVIVSKFGMESVTASLIGLGIGDTTTTIFAAMLALFVPATIIVALKTVFSIANV